MRSRMPFGKYKGLLIKNIIIMDPDYLKFLYNKNKINPEGLLKQLLL